MIHLRDLALSAPDDEQHTRIQDIVINVIATLSILGSVWIILSFVLFKKLRTFRHQLILGLAISDFFMCANFLTSASIDLSGIELQDPKNGDFCSFNGFMTQLFVTQTDYWVFIIAVCTFVILSSSKKQSNWIQEHRTVLWGVAWGLSVLTASLGLGLAGYGDNGAWCWFTNDRTNLLVNYVPRWLMISVMLVLYWRLYQLIFLVHTRFMSFDEEATDTIRPETEWSSAEARPSLSKTIRSKSISHSEMSAREGRELELQPIEGQAGYQPEPTNIPKNSRIGKPSPILKKMAYQMLVYPTIYMIIWIIPTAIRIYHITKHKRADFAISTVDKSCTVIQGFINAIIYGVNEASLSVWSDRFSAKHSSKKDQLNRGSLSIRIDDGGNAVTMIQPQPESEESDRQASQQMLSADDIIVWRQPEWMHRST